MREQQPQVNLLANLESETCPSEMFLGRTSRPSGAKQKG
jgi:hypothetical protein